MKKRLVVVWTVCACVAWADDLTGYGLLPETRVFAPGNGVATNVAERLDGAFNVQANATATGGGIVVLANDANTFSGGAYVKSGTLRAGSVGYTLQPSALGRATAAGTPLVLGNGTFHYTGPDAITDRDVLIKTDQALNEGLRPAVIKVDHELVVSGQFRVQGNGALLKSGPGTLVVRTRQERVNNYFSVGANQIGFGGSYVNAPANGDSPYAGVSAFQVTEGRFVIDTPNTVTNWFGTHESGIGIRSTDQAGKETAAYLDIYGGVNKFGSWLCAARNNGDTTTAPQGLRSEITVYGGETSAGSFGIGYSQNNSSAFTMTGVMTVHGGRLSCGTLRLDHAKSRGEINVDGGTFAFTTGNIAHYNAGAQLRANVSGDGLFQCTGTFDANKTGSTVVRVDLSENGVFECATFKPTKTDGDVSIHANGGTLRMCGNWSGANAYVGAAGTTLCTLDATARTWQLPLASEPGTTDGGVEMTGTGRIDLDATVSLAGGIRLHDADVGLKRASYSASFEQLGAGALVTYATPVSVAGLVQHGTAALKIGASGTTPSTLTTASWTPPETLAVSLCASGTTTPVATAGAYALLTFPESVAFDASQATLATPVVGMDATFAVVANGNGTKTLRLTLAPSATPLSTLKLPDGVTTFADGRVLANEIIVTSRVDKACALWCDGDVTIDGPVTQALGAFVKDGPGTLTFAGAWSSLLEQSCGIIFLGTGDGNSNDPDWFDENGKARLNHAGGGVFNGKMVIGRPGTDDAPEVVYKGGQEFWIGTFTTTNADRRLEYAGELEVNGGRFEVQRNFLCIPRNNGWTGTQASEWLEPKFTQNGGTVEVGKFILGYDNLGQSKTRPIVTINGGTFRQLLTEANSSRIGHNYARGSEATFRVNGGDVSFAAKTIFNYSNSGSSDLVFEMNGGMVDFAGGVEVRNARNTQFNLHGGTLRVVGGFSAGNTANKLSWNGTTMRPVAGGDFSIKGFGNPVLGANGARIDLSEMTGGWVRLAEAFSGAGGITVVGTNANRAVCLDGAATFAGDFTAESGAGVCSSVNNLANVSVRIKDGGAFWGATSSGADTTPGLVKKLAFGESDGDATACYLFLYGNSVKPIQVTETFAVAGTVKVAFRLQGTSAPSLQDGTYTVLKAPKGSIDATKFVFDAAAFPSKTASFRLDSSASDCDALVMTVGVSEAHVHTWTAAGGGAWGEASNWSTIPDGAPGDCVVFPSGDHGTVTLGGDRTVGVVTSAGTVALTDGALVVDNDNNLCTVTASAGTLTLPDVRDVRPLAVRPAAGATVAFAGTVPGFQSTAASDAGTVRATGRVTDDVTVTSGRLEATPSALGERTVSIRRATYRPVASGVSYAHVLCGESGFVVDVPTGVDFVQAGPVTNTGAFVKTGGGTLYLDSSDTTWQLAGNAYGGISSTLVSFKANGDLPTGVGAVSVYGGRVVAGRQGETIHVKGSEMWVGGCPVFDENGNVLDATFDFLGGTLNINGNYLGVGRSWNVSFQNLDRRPTHTFNQYGGDILAGAFVMCWDNQGKQSCKAVYNLHGGSLTVNNRFGMGHMPCTDATTLARLGPSESEFNVYGGSLLSKTGNGETFTIGGQSSAGTGSLNIYGGTATVEKPVYIANNGGKGRLKLAGGVLIAPRLLHSNASSTSTLLWNGGTFRPSSNANALEGLSTNAVAAGGGTIDVSLVPSYVVNQTLTHFAETEGADGGLAKTGAGTLVLKKPMAFTGPLAVHAGCVDLNGSASYALAALTGCGAVSNGTPVVSGYVEPRGAPDAASNVSAVLTVESITLGGGASWRVSPRLDGAVWTADRLHVKGTLTADGPVSVDFGRSDEDGLPRTFAVQFGSFAIAPSSRPRFTSVNHGLPAGYGMTISLRNGTELWAAAAPSGTVIILR